MRISFGALYALLALAGALPAISAPRSGETPGLVNTPSVPSSSVNTSGEDAVRWKIRAEFSRVAVGGVASPVHQTPITLRATNSNGLPLAGVKAALPLIRNSRGRLEPDAKRPFVSPKVDWLPLYKKGETDAKGEIHGVFTSGGVTEDIVLEVPGGQKITIEQAWSDLNDDESFNDGEESVEDGNGTTPVKFTMQLKRGEKMLPIDGHRLKLVIDKVEISAFRRTGKVDEAGVHETEEDVTQVVVTNPEDDKSPANLALWNLLLPYIKVEGMIERKPGEYHGSYRIALPENENILVVGGLEWTAVDHVYYSAVDHNADEGNDTP